MERVLVSMGLGVRRWGIRGRLGLGLEMEMGMLGRRGGSRGMMGGMVLVAELDLFDVWGSVEVC